MQNIGGFPGLVDLGLSMVSNIFFYYYSYQRERGVHRCLLIRLCDSTGDSFDKLRWLKAETASMRYADCIRYFHENTIPTLTREKLNTT